MAATLRFEDYLAGLEEALGRFAAAVGEVDGGARVPSCPDWDVDDVVVHLGTAHRWATAHLDGTVGELDTDHVEQVGRESADRAAWFGEGAERLLANLRAAPVDLECDFFLIDAPEPRTGWTRRQCHEAVLHTVDVLGAARGRPVGPEALWVDPVLATDGVDELLSGFLPRPRTQLRTEEEVLVEVVATDTDAAWTVRLGPHAPQTRHETAVGHPQARAVGTAAELYLGLWNRAPLPWEGLDVGWSEQVHVAWGKPVAVDETTPPPA